VTAGGHPANFRGRDPVAQLVEQRTFYPYISSDVSLLKSTRTRERGSGARKEKIALPGRRLRGALPSLSLPNGNSGSPSGGSVLPVAPFDPMFRSIILALLASLSLSVSEAPAQSLKVGGIELAIGQTFQSAAAELGAIYEVRYQNGYRTLDGGVLWQVRTKAAEPQLIGTIAEKDGKLVLIEQYRNVVPRDDVSRLFQEMLVEAKRLSGATCTTQPRFMSVESTDDIFAGYLTSCGRYELEHRVGGYLGTVIGNQGQALMLRVR